MEALVARGVDANHGAAFANWTDLPTPCLLVTPLSAWLYVLSVDFIGQLQWKTRQLCEADIDGIRVLHKCGATQFIPGACPIPWPRLSVMHDSLANADIVTVLNKVKTGWKGCNSWMEDNWTLKEAITLLLGGASVTEANISKLWPKSEANKVAMYLCERACFLAFLSCQDCRGVIGTFHSYDGQGALSRRIKTFHVSV